MISINFNSLRPIMLLPSLVEIITVVLAKIFECCQYIFTIPLSSSRWKKVCPFFRLNLNLLHQRIFFQPNVVEISPVVLEKYFRFCECSFELKTPSSRMPFAKFGRIGPINL